MQFAYELRSELDRQIQDHRLVELHTHLMGMGDADFWVHLIIETYIPRSTEFAKAHLKDNFDVFYSVDQILEASGYHHDKGDQYAKELAQAKLESKMFDGFSRAGEDLPAFFSEMKQLGPNVGSKRKRSTTDDVVYGVYNSTLAKYLAISGVSSPFHAVVRNWFQFLDPAGNPVSHADILETYRGNFTPQFHPRRFCMRDVILEQRPEIYRIFLNHVLNFQYARSGVDYVEFSLSVSAFKRGISTHLKSAWSTKNQLVAGKLKKFPPAKNIDRQAKIDHSDQEEAEPSADQEEAEPSADQEEGMAEQEEEIIAAVCPDPTPRQMTKPQIQSKCFKFVPYHRKMDNQFYAFLAAFNRKIDYPKLLAAFSVKGNPPNPIVNTFPFPVPNEASSDPNQKLYKLAFLYFKREQFDGNSEQLYAKLKELSEEICKSDELLKDIFPSAFGKLADLKPKKIKEMSSLVVGFDLVGDEFGYPFSPFSHPEFIDVIHGFVKDNKRFGVRFHAGEGLIRPPLNCPPNSPVLVSFILHQYILMSSIYQYCDNYVKEVGRMPNVRIGHGVSFLYDKEEKTPLGRDLKEFREFLRINEYLCELNPTSNHLLLSDSFVGESALANSRTLEAYLACKLPVVLCTDDDGIWAIERCNAHKFHVSVAHEYCQCIMKGELQDPEQLKQMITLARRKAFAFLDDDNGNDNDGNESKGDNAN